MSSEKRDIVFDKEDLKRRSFFGVVTLTSRTFVLQVIALIATFVLTVLLEPSVFGVFFVVTAVVNFLNYFSDIGLAAALIQKREEPTQEDLATTFTIQQLLVVLVVVISFLLAPTVAQFYHLGSSGTFLYQALVTAFFLSSLKTIPSVILERALNFQKLVIPQIAETVVFYTVAIVLAIQGWGIASFAWAAILRGVTGTGLLYLTAPWRPRLLLRPQSARQLLSFGLPYQANSFLALIKDDLLTIFLGKFLPFTQVGYIGWAKKWAEVALRLIMDNIIKVTFPTYSRLQHDPKLLARAIEKSLLFLAMFSFPIAVGMMFLMQPFIALVPRYIKWEPALFSFYLFTISAVLATLSSPLVNALNAVGRIRYTFYLMIVWTTLTWILVPLGIRQFGFNGVAQAAVVIGLTSFLPIFVIRKLVKLRLLSILIKPVVATSFMALTMGTVVITISDPLTKFMVSSVVGFGVYGLLIFGLLRQELSPYLGLLFAKKKSTS